MTVNVALLEQTMTEIMDDPESWDQTTWICGTTGCFAGKVVLNQGWEPVETANYTFDNPLSYTPEGNFCGRDKRVARGEEHGLVSRLARSALGLDELQANLLFQSTNTMEDLQHIIKGLANGETVDDIKTGLSHDEEWV